MLITSSENNENQGLLISNKGSQNQINIEEETLRVTLKIIRI